MKNPLVSIIVTTKNEEKNISRLLRSVKKQSYSKIETILVDHPGTTDSTRKIAKSFKCKIFEKGPERSAQRNFGVKKANGEYVLIVDADMSLGKKVVEDCVETTSETKRKLLIIPEATKGKSLLAKIRKFEREMYMGDETIEVARFFEKKVFEEFDGYDESLTGTEDYDLPRRISRKYPIGWSKEYLYHHEDDLSLKRQLRKKFYYANKSAGYVEKHPDLVRVQGVLIFRKAYLRHWKKFIKNPFMAILFICVRFLETFAAALGFIKAVGVLQFVKTLIRMFKS
ncbi:MAG: glycosyltransferase [bacterium]